MLAGVGSWHGARFGIVPRDLRIRLADEAGTIGRVATAIGAEGAQLGAIDPVRIEKAHKVRDVTIRAEDETHIERVVAAVNCAHRRGGPGGL